MILSTDRLMIRPMCAADALAFFELERLEEVNRYQSYAPMTEQDAVKYATEAEDSWRSSDFPSWQEFSVTRSDKFIGRIGFEHENGVANVWFALMPKFHRQGLATEALHALMSYLRGDNVQTVVAD